MSLEKISKIKIAIKNLKIDLREVEDNIYALEREQWYHRDPLLVAMSDLDYVIGNNYSEKEIKKCEEKIESIKIDKLNTIKEYYDLVEERNSIFQEIKFLLISLYEELENSSNFESDLSDLDEEIYEIEEDLKNGKEDQKELLYEIVEQDSNFVHNLITEVF